jgi:hypothetical protein
MIIDENVLNIYLKDIHRKKFNKITIEEENYHFEIFKEESVVIPYIIRNGIYTDTTLNNIITTVQQMGCKEAILE